MNRAIGVLILKAQTYKEIAEDKQATMSAGVIVVLALLVSGFASGFVVTGTDGAVSSSLVGGVIGAIVELLFGLVAWVFSAWLTAVIARGIFQGNTDTGEMLRVGGYAMLFSFFDVLGLLALVSPTLLCILSPLTLFVSLCSIWGNVLGIRESAEFSTGKAIVTGIIAGIVRFLIVVMATAFVAGMIVATLGAVSAGLGGS